MPPSIRRTKAIDIMLKLYSIDNNLDSDNTGSTENRDDLMKRLEDVQYELYAYSSWYTFQRRYPSICIILYTRVCNR